jgi:hypothetical protein
MTITVAETIAIAADAQVDFTSLPQNRVIVVWGAKAQANGTQAGLPNTIGRLLTAQGPGSGNQFLVVGLDITPASAPLAYPLTNLSTSFASGGWEIDGLEVTDLNRLCDEVNHVHKMEEAGTTQTAAAFVTPGTWQENEGFAFIIMQHNQSIGACGIIEDGWTQTFLSNSRVVFHKVLGPNDKGTKITGSILWQTPTTFEGILAVLKPPAVVGGGTPQSNNLILSRAIIDDVRTDLGNIGPNLKVLEPLVDAYELEVGHGVTTALRDRMYRARRALAEAIRLCNAMQSSIDALQGVSTPTVQYKAVYDDVAPFSGAVTDVTNGVSFSADRWFGIRTTAGAVVTGGLLVSWWWDKAFSQSPTQPDTVSDGPDWRFKLPRGVNGSHTLGVRIQTLSAEGDVLATEEHTYTITTSGAPANSAPVVNAGSDATVAAGSISSLTMTATDPDGDILDPAAAGWSQVSGPAALEPRPPANSRTWSGISWAVPGAYTLEARQADPAGAVGVDSKIVTVSALPSVGPAAKATNGLFGRTGYNGVVPHLLDKDAQGAVDMVKFYWEVDGLTARYVREVFAPQDWNSWRTNVTNYLPIYAQLCGTTPTRTMVFAIPMFTGDEFSNTHESMRQAYARGAQGDYINANEWGHLKNKLLDNGYGVSFPVIIDPFSEYDLGNPGAYPNNVGQAGRLNWGRMRDGAACARRLYEYLKPDLPLLEFGCCRISTGGSPLYMNINNQVETFGGAFPNGLNMSAALLYELNRAAPPLKAWWSYLAVNFYGPTMPGLSKWNDTCAAAEQYGIQVGSEEWGVSPNVVVADNATIRTFITGMRDLFNSRPATGPGSVKLNIYFEGLNPSCLYSNYPLALAHYKQSSHFGA